LQNITILTKFVWHPILGSMITGSQVQIAITLLTFEVFLFTISSWVRIYWKFFMVRCTWNGKYHFENQNQNQVLWAKMW